MTSREELYQLVWSKPMIKVAEQLGVSGSYMARVCTVLNVPRPERGYWAKLAVGKAPTKTPLPDARPGDQLHWSNDGTIPPSPPIRQQQPPVQRKARIRIPKTYIHPLIRGAKGHFDNSRPVDEGGYLKPFKKLLVDVTASKTCIEKALEFANELFNAFESAGHRVVIAPNGEHVSRATIDEREVQDKPRDRYHYSNLWSPYRPTVVYIGSLAIGLAVIEMSESALLRYVDGKYIRESDYTPPKASRHYANHTWTTTRDIPSGRLRLVAYSPYWRVHWSIDWQDTKKTSLHSALKSIVKSVEESSIELIAKLEEADRKAEIARLEHLAAEERRRREEDRRQIEKSVQESQEHLGQIIQQWSSVMSVAGFLTGVEQSAFDLTEEERAPVLERLKLAREFLGTQAPLNFFMAWTTPAERYQPRFPAPSVSSENGD